MISSRGVRPNDLPPRLVLAAGRIAWLGGQMLHVQDGAQASRAWPLARPLGLAATAEGAVVAIGAAPRGDAELEVLRIARDGREQAGRVFAYADQVAFLFCESERETWLLAPGRSPELARFVLEDGGARVVAAQPIGLGGPTAAVRLADGEFLLASPGALLRVTPPRLRREGGQVREISDADWQHDLRQLCRCGGEVLARGPNVLHVLDGAEPTRRLAHHEVTGEILHRVAGADEGVAVLSYVLEASGPRWVLSAYDRSLRPRWRRDLGARWGWDRIDLALDAERVVAVGGDGKPASFDAANGAPAAEAR